MLVTGGEGSAGWLTSAEVYDRATGRWTAAGQMNDPRWEHTATLLPSGKVLIAGGSTNGFYPTNAELYSMEQTRAAGGRPEIGTMNSPLDPGDALMVSGSNFRGISEGSNGGTPDSPADYPLLQLRHIETGQTLFLDAAGWSTNSFISAPVWRISPGCAVATVYVNGIPSIGRIIRLNVPVPTETVLGGAKGLANGSFQFSFTNSVGAVFSVLATTNLALPTTNWTVLGGVTEVGPGQFQFIDPQPTNMSVRFYRLGSQK